MMKKIVAAIVAVALSAGTVSAIENPFTGFFGGVKNRRFSLTTGTAVTVGVVALAGHFKFKADAKKLREEAQKEATRLNLATSPMDAKKVEELNAQAATAEKHAAWCLKTAIAAGSVTGVMLAGRFAVAPLAKHYSKAERTNRANAALNKANSANYDANKRANLDNVKAIKEAEQYNTDHKDDEGFSAQAVPAKVTLQETDLPTDGVYKPYNWSPLRFVADFPVNA